MNYFFSKKPQEEDLLLRFFKNENKAGKIILEKIISIATKYILGGKRGEMSHVEEVVPETYLAFWQKLNQKMEAVRAKTDEEPYDKKHLTLEINAGIDNFLFGFIRNKFLEVLRRKNKKVTSLDASPKYQEIEAEDTPLTIMESHRREDELTYQQQIMEEELEKLGSDCKLLLKNPERLSTADLSIRLDIAPKSVPVKKNRCKNYLIKAVRKRLGI